MKKEDIYNGVTDIRDDIIEKARKKSGKRVWRGAIAAVLAVCAAAGGFAAWRFTRPDAGGYEPGKDILCGTADPGTGDQLYGSLYKSPIEPLAEVTYPERLHNPELLGDSFSEDEYDRWWEDKRDRRLTDGELGTLSGYISAVMPALLRAPDGENAVCSPMNVYMALSLLAEVTEGQTREQVLGLLGVKDLAELRPLANRMWNSLYNADGTYSLSMANSIWLRDDWDYSEDTVKAIADNYYAWAYRGRMGSAELNETLRTWLNGNTGGLLQDQIGGIGLDDETALCLASTMYFGDKWHSKFDPDRTETGIFHSTDGDVESDFMCKTISFNGTYYWGDNFGAVVLAFDQGGSMRLLLPDEGVSMDEILRDEAAMSFLAGDRGKVNSTDIIINLRVPKFDVESQADLKDALVELGVTDAFDPDAADFSPIVPGERAWLSSVLHGARVRVDEDGCEAAAYTIMPAVGAAPPPTEEMDLSFDRPFIFSAISNGLPIFTGVVNRP